MFALIAVIGAAFAVAMNRTATMPMAPVLSLWPESTGTSTNSLLPVRSWLVIEVAFFSARPARPRVRERPDASVGSVSWITPSGKRVAPPDDSHKVPCPIVCFRFVRDHTIDTIALKGMHCWLSHCSGARGASAVTDYGAFSFADK